MNSTGKCNDILDYAKSYLLDTQNRPREKAIIAITRSCACAHSRVKKRRESNVLKLTLIFKNVECFKVFLEANLVNFRH